MYDRNSKVLPVYIEQEMKDSYISYAMSVIVGRALPEVRDGLKPVHRRILYSMRELNLEHNKPYKKCARIVGECLGKYHPHGDLAVYDALVRMAQDFSLRYPLIDGQGNFGSIDGDPAAAMRYTEARLDQIAEEILGDIDKDTVDFMPNFDDSLEEPKILPARLPNLLLNGSSGIAVGMATNIPPHNINEVIDGICAVIEDPSMDVKDIMKIIKGPDFPTGGIISGREGIKQAYQTGRGIIKLNAKANIETGIKGGKERIIISEIPYQVNKTTLIESMAELVQAKKIDGISDIRDESDKDGMRVVIDLKRDANSQVVLNQLYTRTQMQSSFGIIMLALVNNRPRILNLRQIIDLYIDHRKDIVIRRTKFELKKAQERAHILEGLKIAIKFLDRVIALIKKSESPEKAKKGLMEKFALSDVQAQAILEMQLQRLTALERDKVEKEYLELIKKIEYLTSVLESPKKVLQIIKDELGEIKKKYADERRTQIVAEAQELDIEDLIAEEDMVITISHAGYIKRLPVSSYRKQHRGGRGVTGVETKEEDFIEHLFIASTHHYILFFTNAGRLYWLKVHEIPQAGRASKGKPIVNLLQLSGQEKISSFVPVKEFNDKDFLVMATEEGMIKKTKLIEYSRPRPGGIIGITINKDDNLIGVVRTDGDREIVLATEQGKAIRFLEKGIRTTGRKSQGVIGVRLAKKDKVVGMEIVDEKATILVVTENGFGKRTEFNQYRRQSRGGKGIINVKTTKRNGLVVGVLTVVDKDEIMLITKKGIIIRTSVGAIKAVGRNTQGVLLMRLEEKDTIGAVAKVVSKEEEEEA
jgi:DNA gyrase subunit A